MSFEENAGGLVPGELTTTVIGEYTYYGNPKLVDRVIEQWKKKKMQGHGDKGLYGEVFKVTNTLLSLNIRIDNKEYYVKQLIPKIYEMPSIKGQPTGISAIDEIRIANELTAIVPDSVSNFKGARIRNSGYPVISEIEKAQHKAEDLIVKYKLEEFATFIVFEGLEGISLFDACEKIKNSGKTERQRLKQYATLFCSAKRAIESINTAGYIHGDIHNKNIIVIGDGDTAKCKLIDFGRTEKLARPSLSAGVVQTKYTVDINALIKDCIHRYFFTDFFDYPPDYPNFRHETQDFLTLVVDSSGKRGTDFFRITFKTEIEQEYVDALGDFFFSLCGKLIRMRDVPGQIAYWQKMMNRNIKKQRLYTEHKTKRNSFIQEKKEYNTLFNTPNIPLPVANLNHELGSTLFGPNTTNLPPPTFLMPEGAVPEVPGAVPEVPGSVRKMVQLFEKGKGKGGKRRKTKRRKTKHRRTRRV